MMPEAKNSWWASRIIVLATGLALGFFVWRTYFDPVPYLYPVEFSQGQWLVASDGGPQGYFRKELYIPGKICQAWIMIAATDSFVVYLNGKALDGKGYASLKVSGIYDVGHYLHPGKNVLGVVARRLSYPGAAMAVLEGAYRDETGREHVIATDTSWQFSPLEQRQGGGEIPWYGEAFDASSWTAAQEAARSTPMEVYPLSVHPLAFTMPPQGKWISHANFPLAQAALSFTLNLPAGVEDAWIRVAAAKSCALVVNGVTVQGQPSTNLPGMGLDGGSTWKHDQSASTNIYNIRAFLRAGLNRITVSSEGFPTLPGSLVDGFVMSQGRLLTFGTDATWTINAQSGTVHGGGIEQSNPLIFAANELLPIKQAMTVIPSGNFVAKRIAKLLLVLALTATSIYLLWRGTARLLSLLQGSALAEAETADALFHSLVLLSLGCLFLLSYDVRMDPAFPFQPQVVWCSVAALLALRITLLLEAWYRKKRALQGRQYPVQRSHSAPHRMYLIALAGVIATGAYLRLHDLDAQSLYHDEIHMVAFVRGLLEKGYPHKMVGPIERPLATYELVPYPIALSAMLFGFNDFALRLPAALFGVMTIVLIYRVGQRVFDQRIGLLAAAVYSFCPQALVWAKYLWNPQQTQFFALLTSYLFYQAIQARSISTRHLYLAALSFVLTYLSWEGAGFLLPALGLGLVAIHGRDFTWVRDKHIWIAGGLIAVAVAVQLAHRLLLQIPYLVVGTGLSDVSLPTLFFLDPMYDPAFYISNFLFLENNILLCVALSGGLIFLASRSGLRYYYTLLFAILFMMTNLLPRATIRYAYYLQPFLILSSVAAALYILTLILSMHSSCRTFSFSLVRSTLTTLIFFLFPLMSSSAINLFRFTSFDRPTGVYTRSDIYYIDYRSSSQFLSNHYFNNDLVLSVMPETLRYYSGIHSHYFSEHYASRQVFYDPMGTSQRYIEKTVGVPVLRGIDELQDVISNNKRVWFVAVPYPLFLSLFGPDVMEYINKTGKITYESYNARIYLLQN